MYAPVCTVLEIPIPPCRSLCIDAKTGCEELMNRFGFQWPVNLDCDRFPVSDNSGTTLCVGENHTMKEGGPTPTRGGIHLPDGMILFPDEDEKNFKRKNGETGGGNRNIDGAFGSEGGYRDGVAFECPHYFKVPSNFGYRLKFRDNIVEDCGLPCGPQDDPFFGPARRKFSRYLLGIASTICLISTLFTLLTYLTDTTRFR